MRPDELAELVEAERIACGVPGASVAVVSNGEVVLARGFGHRNADADETVTSQTLFAIGSATKAFTATLIGSLVDSGELEWDRPVRAYLPELRMWDDSLSAQITLRDMLSHRTGLPRHDLVWYGNAAIRRRDFVAALPYLQPSAPIRQRWAYNNIMYVVAGYVAERVLGQSWEDAVRGRLLEPLGMSRTNFSVEETQNSANHSNPHMDIDGVTRPIPFRDLSVVSPAGAINSCADDVASWLLVNLEDGCADGRKVISASTIRQLHAPAMIVPPPAVEWPEVHPVGYALGWFVDEYRGDRLLHHGGNIDGFSAMISLVPRAKVGIAVLTNLDNSSLRDSVPRIVLDALLGHPRVNWGERHRAATAAIVDGPRQSAAHRASQAAGHPPSRPLHHYAGVYAHPAYGEIAVGVGPDGRLEVRYHDLQLDLVHRDYDAFELQQTTARISHQIRFEADFDGFISRLCAVLEPAVPAIEFARVPQPPLDQATIEALAGEYSAGPLLVRVMLAGQLQISIANQPPAALERRHDLTFGVSGQPGTTVVFTLDECGAGAEVVVGAIGRFIRRSGDAPAPAAHV